MMLRLRLCYNLHTKRNTWDDRNRVKWLTEKRNENINYTNELNHNSDIEQL